MNAATLEVPLAVANKVPVELAHDVVQVLNRFGGLNQQQAAGKVSVAGEEPFQVPGVGQLQPVEAIVHQQTQILQSSPRVDEASVQEVEPLFLVLKLVPHRPQ